MTMAMNVFDACKAAEHAENLAEWATQNPEASEIYTWVMRLDDA
jgi:hypothetical protein